MEKIISKKELSELRNLKGEVRADGMKNYAAFILKEEGGEGLEKLEETMADLGYPLKFKDVKAMDFYPVALEAVMLVLIRKLFNYNNEKFNEMGGFFVKTSLFIRFFAKYFFSIERVLQEIPKMWRKHLTQGTLKVVEHDMEKRYLILRIEDFHHHPLHCQILIGYFPAALQMIIKSKGVCQETKCVHRGDEYHEFSVRW